METRPLSFTFLIPASSVTDETTQCFPSDPLIPPDELRQRDCAGNRRDITGTRCSCLIVLQGVV